METTTKIPLPKVVTQEEWLEARKKLLADEKEVTRHYDRVSAQRRRLPMVKVDKPYRFDTTEGNKTLVELFGDKTLLLVYHFMYGPDDTKACPGCTSFVDALGDLSSLDSRDATFVVISRGPLEKLLAYKRERGWDRPWVSSFGSDFNFDFHVSNDEAVAPMQYNYTDKGVWKGEAPGFSVFLRDGQDVYHTYSTFARGVESLTDAYAMLDRTPYGRQEDWEDSPEGWPQRPTYG